jgi:hypothetical protein
MRARPVSVPVAMTLSVLLLAATPGRSAGAPRGGGSAVQTRGEFVQVVPVGVWGPRWSVGFGWGWPYPAWGWYGPPPYPYGYARPIPRDASFVEFHIHPWKAEIRVDGHDVGRAKDYNSDYAPLVIRAGRHVLELSYPDFMTYRTRIKTEAGGYYVLRYRLDEGRGLDPRSRGIPEAEPQAPPAQR